jgi:hypothetical protein
MSGTNAFTFFVGLGRGGLLGMLLAIAHVGQVMAADVVRTYKDENGWKLLVNGKDYYVKGMVWSYTPRGENYTYDLWGQPDEFVKKILDYDFSLMEKAGVNTIRTFNSIPPKWVTYVYQEYGIRTIVNHLAARYGNSYTGKWVANTNYQDPLTRAAMKADVLRTVERFKNTPGLLMFALGNEANYGLSWSSFEIENFPEGEQQKEKARYLYSIYNEIIAEAKKITSDVPYTIVNGDIQYIDLIKEYCTDLDILGTNVYRGNSFTTLWKEVDEKLDIPVVLMEFGSDAFNARTNSEDQASQAYLLKDQWQEMYNKSYGNGEEGNSIGGTVFEWRDEWWKYKQTENLDKHDNNASWANGGYPSDFREGENNMNEEWWGIAALGTANSDGVYEAHPRMAYDVLTEVWSIDPYMFKKEAINQVFANMNMEFMQLKSDVRILKAESRERKEIISFTGADFRSEFVLKGNENDIDLNGENGVQFSDQEMIFLDFGFQPTDKIKGALSVNLLGNVADKDDIEISYGRQRELVEFDVPDPDNPGLTRTVSVPAEDRERIEIYNFESQYTSNEFDIDFFYHVPRYHWKYKGDFYGLRREATDVDETGSENNMDIWNAKAPFGVEFTGKELLNGLSVLAGPEVYWGANPQIMLKYSSKIGDMDYTLMHQEDLARISDNKTASSATERQSRATTAYLATNLGSKVKLEVGGIMARGEREGDVYFTPGAFDTVNNRPAVLRDEIDFVDTLGAKAKVTYSPSGMSLGSLAISETYLKLNYSGLVADGGEPLKELGHDSTHLPLSEGGNREEVEAGVLMRYGDAIMIYPRVLYRDNLVDANQFYAPDIPNNYLGLTPRNTDDDPFAVTGNRAARSAEIFFTYDPTGETFFYDWDNDARENAKLAFNLGLNYTEFPTATDNQLFFDGNTKSNLLCGGVGQPADHVWKASSKIVTNPSRNLRMILRLIGGQQQSTCTAERGAQNFYEIIGSMSFDGKHHLSGYFKKDAWGPYDFQKQLNFTYPEQYKFDYAYLLDEKRHLHKSSKVGIRTIYRTLDADSPEGEDGTSDYDFLTIFYFKWAF